MAANTSFKIQCPSCEAMVPIRDPNLVGKKIDCPKCKYRFVVEEPEGEEHRPARKPKAAAKKKGGNNVLILGSILGGVVLIVLGGVAYLLMTMGDTGPAKSAGGSVASNPPPISTAPAVSTTPAANTAAMPNTTPNTDATVPAPAAPTAPAAPEVATLDPGRQEPVPEITNLLPNDTQSVISINMDRLRICTLGQLAFESPIGFRPDTFKKGFGIGVEEMAWFVRGENFGQNWSFNVIKTHRPVTLADFHALGLKKGPKSPIQGRNYFVIAPNPLLDHLSTILQSEIESRETRNPTKKGESAGPLTLALLDETTVVVAHQDAMEEFLEANAQPTKKATVIGAAGGDAAAPQPPAAPGGGRLRPRGLDLPAAAAIPARSSPTRTAI